ncbi:MAG: hypothetical protein RID91_00965 [Azospirillaceae bacterium]
MSNVRRLLVRDGGVSRSLLSAGSPVLLERRTLWSALPVVLALVVYYHLKHAYLDVATATPWTSVAALGGCLVIAIAGLRVTYRDVSPALGLLIRGVTVVVGLYTVVAGVVVPPGLAQPYAAIRAVEPVGLVVILGCTIAALWRPAFAVLPNVAALAAKSISAQALGLGPLSPTDYLPLVDLASFGALSILVWHLVARVPGLRFICTDDKASLPRVSTLIFFVILSAHFANYFYSGVQKIVLDGALPWTWADRNPTAMLSEVATVGGFAPLAHWSGLNSAVISVLWVTTVPANWAVLITQLAAVAVVFSRRFTLATIAFYDIAHVAIFIASGIFFWKWILLNAILISAVYRLDRTDFRRFGYIACVTVLASPLVFFVARLGWYDTGAFNRHVVLAEMEDGRLLEVPSNYFSIASITVAQNRLGTIGPAYPTQTWGTTQSREVRDAALDDCTFPGFDEAATHYRGEVAEVERFFRRFHAFRQPTLDDRGRVDYDLFPHHIWSNPFAFDAFKEADKRDIVAYRYGNDRLCFVRENGRGVLLERWPGPRLRIPVPAGE